MRTALKLLPPLLFGLLIGTGCSLLVNFDPEGQKCDATGGCAAGYGCVLGKCMAGVDAGTSLCGRVCAAGEKCLESSGQCVPNTCQYTRCAVGSLCTESTGTPICRPVQSPALGHPCTDDVDCASSSNRFCYRGAIPNDNPQGSFRTGICVERCLTFGGCLTSGATCRDFVSNLDAGATKLCVPDNLLASCRSDFDCIDPRFVCTVFDNPNLGPATVCDAALGSGAQPGASCTSSKADGGTLPYCANGLCLPQTGQPATCGQTCGSTCPGSQQCVPTEITIRGTPRHIPMCQTKPSFCNVCASDSACSADAPRCTNFGTNIHCLSACSTTGGGTCPGGQTCAQLDAGLRCVPLAANGSGGTGTCP